MNTVLMIGIVLAVAILGELVSEKLKLPVVVGYVVFGVLFGKSVIGVFNPYFINNTAILNDFALGLMAFTIGAELKKSLFVKLGKSIFFIVFFEASLAFVFVTITMYFLNPEKLYQAIILGAMASATAPAATIAVIQQYKAKGPLTSTILAVVGIDDAMSLIIFAFAATFAKSLISGTHLSIIKVIVHPVIEISIALALGISFAFLSNIFFKKIRNPEKLSIRVAAIVAILLGLSNLLDVSELLSIMAFAATLVNINPILTNRSMGIVKHFEPIFYALFFILAGANLDLSLFKAIGLMGLFYTVARGLGKYAGGSIGAILGKAPAKVKKYVGMGLLPQLGVAVGLAIVVNKMFGMGEYGEAGKMLSKIVLNILLFTTIITEIVGPLLTRFAIIKSGEQNN
jgi:Kef-type K+ transport system membrane component KefB